MEQVVVVVEANHVNKSELAEVLKANPQIFKEPKPFLFVSEEGEDVHEGDNWLDVYIEDQENVSAGTIAKGNIHSFVPNAKGVLRFVDVGAAEHCALTHTKIFSINDVVASLNPNTGQIDYRELMSLLN